MCSDTSSSQGLISQGGMGVWHVYILFPFPASHQRPLPLYFLVILLALQFLKLRLVDGKAEVEAKLGVWPHLMKISSWLNTRNGLVLFPVYI